MIIRTESIRSVQDSLASLYDSANRNKSPEYLYGYFSRTAAYLGKSLRKRGGTEPEMFIRPLSWAFALASGVKQPLDDAIAARLPNRCQYCLEAPCVCYRTGKQPLRQLTAYKFQEELDRYKVDLMNRLSVERRQLAFHDLCASIRFVYPHNAVIWHHAGPNYHILKISEEVGEVHEELARFQRSKTTASALQLAGEIADAVAWIAGAWVLTYPEATLESAFDRFYARGCPNCKDSPCSCEPNAARPAGVVSIQQVGVLHRMIVEATPAQSSVTSELTQIAAALASVNELRSPAALELAVRNTRNSLIALRDRLDAPSDEPQRTSLQSIVRFIDAMAMS